MSNQTDTVRPCAWMRCMRVGGIFDPAEYDADIVYGDESPGDGWTALYTAADYDALRAEVDELHRKLDEAVQRSCNGWARAEAADAKVSNVIHNDVYTLMGHAEILRMRGEDDMPKYLLELAGRISQVIGDKALSDRCAALNEGDGE